MQRFYFTFGSDPKFPYPNGWVEVIAPNRGTACELFAKKFPNPDGENILLCSDYYTEEQFYKTGMFDEGNFRGYCHEVLRAHDKRKSVPRIELIRSKTESVDVFARFYLEYIVSATFDGDWCDEKCAIRSDCQYKNEIECIKNWLGQKVFADIPEQEEKNES